MKHRTVLLLAVLMLLSLTACAAAKERADAVDSVAEYYAEASAMQYQSNYSKFDGAFQESYPVSASGENLVYEAAEMVESGDVADASSVEQGRKLIRKIHLSVETDDYRAFVDAFQQKLLALGGYIEEMEANTSGRCPSATILVRVPADQLTALTDSVSGIGNITYKYESQQDVTLQYTDTQSHITALRTEQDRLLQLLSKAENLSEILEIEDRMTDVRYALESYESSLRALSNQVSYATATIDVSQVEVFTPTEELGYWEKLGKGIGDSVKDLWQSIKELFGDFVISLPYLLVALVLPLLVLILVIKRIRRRRKAKLAQNMPAASASDSDGAQG